jgi:predicted RNase H-like HicB family nuclease
MEIPVAIHKDENSVYGVIVPDVPGCFSWGDSIEDAMQNTREAIYSHVQAMLAEGVPVEIRQSSIEDLAAAHGYVGAVWALVQIDVGA